MSIGVIKHGSGVAILKGLKDELRVYSYFCLITRNQILDIFHSQFQ